MLRLSDSVRVPSYRRHKPSGQAVVTLNGRDVYLGKWNTNASRAEYDRLLGEWLADGRFLPPDDPHVGLTVTELALRYWRYAKGYYVKDGRPTGALPGIKVALRILRTTYGPTRASDFGTVPVSLRGLIAVCWRVLVSRLPLSRTPPCPTG
jgi:hypothetical protein